MLFRSGTITYQATLRNNATAKAIYDILPLETRYNTWGNEIYFSIPCELELEEDCSASVEVGDLAFWPPGKAFCIFYGKTPASIDDQPRAASEVSVFGTMDGDCALLKKAKGGKISVEKIES